MQDQIQPKFEAWAIIELFGHTVVAGKVSEQVIAGTAFIRIDVPATDGMPAFIKLHNPTSIYSMTPVDEDYAVRMAEKLQVQPVNNYSHTQVIRELVQKRVEALQAPKESIFEDQDEGPIDYLGDDFEF